jgi:hypothetical protein
VDAAGEVQLDIQPSKRSDKPSVEKSVV